MGFTIPDTSIISQVEEPLLQLWRPVIHGSGKIVPMISRFVCRRPSHRVWICNVYRGEEVNEGYLVTGLLIPDDYASGYPVYGWLESQQHLQF